MNALVLESINSWPEYKEVEAPKESPGMPSIQIKAAALNRRDLWITQGMYPNIKLPCILGSDGAGMLDGRKVIINPGLNWGEDERVQSDEFEVLGMPKNGTFADHLVVPEGNIYDMPEHLSFEEAAALPLGGVTAYRTLMVRCQAQSTDKILITGAGGGVAQFAIQFALAIGAEVYVTSGDDKKIEEMKKLGVAGGVNYKSKDWDKDLKKMTGGLDVVIDSAGGDGFQRLVKLMNPGGRIGFYGASLGKYNNLNPQIMFWRQISLLGSTMGSDQDFQNMLQFVNEYKITPVIDMVLPMTEGKQALQRMESGEQLGKIVLVNP